MADTKISALAAAGTLTGAEAIPAVQGSATVRLTPAQLQTYVLGSAAGVEAVQDIVGGLVSAGPGVTIAYNDAGNALTIDTALRANVAAIDPGASADAAAGFAPGSTWLNSASGVRWICLEASAGAAQWAPQGALWHPGYVAGRTYTPPRSAIVANVAAVADTLYAIPLPIGQRVTLSALNMYIGTGAAGSVRLALYGNGAAGPGARLAETGAGSTGTAAALSLALTANVTLPPGPYWLAALFSAAPTPISISAADQTMIAQIGAATPSTAFSSGSSACGVVGSGATFAGGFPAAFGTATPRTLATPLIGFTAA